MRGGTWNIRGLSYSYRQVQSLMLNNQLDWLFITETHLQPESKPLHWDDWLVHSLPQPIRNNQRSGRNHGGIALMINPSRVRHVQVIASCPESRYAMYKIDGLLVVGTYLAPSLPQTAFEEAMDKIAQLLPTERFEEPAIIIGDLNSNLKLHDSLPATCPRGRFLTGFTVTNDLEPALPSDGNYGTTVSQSPHWLDMILMNPAASTCSTRLHHDHRIRAYSDHVPVQWEYELPAQNEAQLQPVAMTISNIRFKLAKLQIPEIRARHRRYIETNMTEFRTFADERMHEFRMCPRPTIAYRARVANQLNNKLTDAIIDAADRSCGRCKPTVCASRELPSPTISRLQTVVSKLQTEINELDLPPENWRHETIRKTIEKLRKAMQTQSKDQWRSFTEQMDEDDISLFLQTLKRMRRGRSKGITPELSKAELDHIADTYETQTCPCASAPFGFQPVQQKPDEVVINPDQGNPWDAPPPTNINERFSTEAVLRCIRHSGNGKASGIDNISKELLGDTLRPTDDSTTIAAIATLFDYLYEIGCLPDTWATALVVPIYKNKGSRTDWTNWRPISLLPYLRKIFESCMSQSIVLDGYSPMQGGFCPQKSTLDQVATLSHAIHILKRKKSKVYMAFLDIWAAFDTVDRKTLWDLCRNRGTPDRDIRLLSRLQESNCNAVVGHNIQSRTYHAAAGVQQGGTLSPLLYNVLIDGLCQRLEEAQLGIFTADRKHIPGGLYADDVVLIADSPEKLQLALDICERHSQELKYRWKPSKSHIVASDERNQFMLYARPLEYVPHFKYLGVPVNANGICGDELILQNIQKAKQASQYLSSLGVNSNGFTPYRNALAWKTFVRPCYEYGLSLLALSKQQIHRIESSMNATLKKAIGGYSSSSSEAIRQLCLVDPIDMRHAELQSKLVLRLVNASPMSLVKRWLGDALQDSSSPLRQAIAQNNLLKQKWQPPPMGPRLPQLWTESETAAMQFNLSRNRPWTYDANGEYPPGQQSIQSSDVKNWKQERTSERYASYTRSNSNILARDLPEIDKTSNILKKLKLSRFHWRLLLGWLIGFFPSHRKQQCHVCGNQLPESGVRRHVALCVLSLPTSNIPPDISERARMASTPAAWARRATSDPITDMIWLLAAAADPNQSPVTTTLTQCLEAVCSLVLLRNP